MEEIVAEVEFSSDTRLDCPGRAVDRVTRSDRLEDAVEPAPLGHNPRPYETPVFALENFFSERHNQMLIEPEH